MITRVRLEAEASDLQSLIGSLDAAQKALKLPKEMLVSDEHYERVGASFKGRRVFGPEEKGGGINIWWQPNQSCTAWPYTWTYTNSTASGS